MDRQRGSVAAVVGILLLSGCSASAAPGSSPGAASATPRPTTSENAPAAPETFTQPTECAGILPTGRLDTFAADSLVLLGGPGGRYGDDYLLDSTPEQLAGGITCIWGRDDTEVSSLSISVAPLSASTRAGVVESLTDQGLNEVLVGRAATYGQQGDQTDQPAITNVLQTDSWISVIATVGGLDAYNDAVVIADEVHGQVYSAG